MRRMRPALELELLAIAAAAPSVFASPFAPLRRPSNPTDAELEQERARQLQPSISLGFGARRILPVRYE